MGDTLTIALVANTTSRYPFATGEWRGHFKNVGMYSRRIAYRDTCYMNKQVLRILETPPASESTLSPGSDSGETRNPPARCVSP